ncbi:MAG: glycosyltransferase [Flavobacteriales bacterium]
MLSLELILFFCFVLAIIVQLYYSLFIFPKWQSVKQEKTTFSKPISVVVCGYNEALHWEHLVDRLLAQDYPKFEIVLVNDQSTDHTKLIFKQWENQPNIKLVDIDENIKKGLGKKFALTLGIKAAKYDYLLLTDADCYPKNNHWISSMAQQFAQNTIVLGYGAYEKQAGWLNKLIRFDTFLVALQYFSYASIGLAYMGVGRNLAYKKSLFFDNKGFASHLHLPSGDDDLFIKEVSLPNNTTIATKPSAHTLSIPKLKWSAWIRQKSRHLTTGNYYKPIHQWMLGLWSISQIMTWLLCIVLIVLGVSYIHVLTLLLIRTSVFMAVSFPLLKQTEEKDLLVVFPFLELSFIFFYIIFIVNRLIQNKRFW